MVCDGQKLKIYNYIKGRRIKTEDAPLVSYAFSLNTWYRNSNDQTLMYFLTQDGYNYIAITYNNVIGMLCNDNPVSNCDCIFVGGSVLDSQINTALSILPLEKKKNNSGLIIGGLVLMLAAYVGYAVLKKK